MDYLLHNACECYVVPLEYSRSLSVPGTTTGTLSGYATVSAVAGSGTVPGTPVLLQYMVT